MVKTIICDAVRDDAVPLRAFEEPEAKKPYSNLLLCALSVLPENWGSVLNNVAAS